MRVQLLGRVCATTDAGHAEPSGLLRKGLLALLALQAERTVAVDELIDGLWGDQPPATATNTLQSHVSYLRRLLGGPGAVEGGRSGYRLAVDLQSVDATRAQQLVDAASALDEPARRRDALGSALALWHGPSLADARGITHLDRQADRLDALRLSATQQLIEVRLQLGEHAALVPDLENLVTAHPFQESLHAQLMLALYRGGRQADALAAYRRVQVLLDDELGVTPGPELVELHSAILRHDESLTQPVAAATSADGSAHSAGTAVASSGALRPRPVPVPLAAFLDREEERARLGALLLQHRLVTITGPGGTGKTRLALEAAAQLDNRFEALAFVDLAALPAQSESVAPEGNDPRDTADVDRVTEEVLRALGLTREGDIGAAETLHAAVADRELLLVFDNCEHVLDAVADTVSALLEAAPRSRVLATSREQQHVPGEIVLPLEPLPLPDGEQQTDAVTVAQALESPAVQLLVQRAGAADPSFRLTADNVDLITRLCRRLDGLPLAIELAAARLRALPPADLLASLDDSHAILDVASRTMTRGSSLRATLEWSHDLLTEAERSTFARFAVFEGGAALDLAAEVCGPGKPLVAAVHLAGLVERSMLRRVEHLAHASGSQVSRLDAHEVLRRFARVKLETGHEEHDARALHAQVFLRVLLERAAPRSAQAALASLAPEHRNVEAAIRWAATHDGDLAARLAAASWWFWWRMGRADVGRDLMDAALNAPGASASPRYAGALLAAGYLAWVGDDCDAALSRARAVLDQPDVSPADAAFAHGLVSRALGDQGDFAGAVQAARRSCRGYAALGDDWSHAWSLRCSAAARVYLGELAEAVAEATECLDVFRALDDVWGEAGTLDLLATAAVRSGQTEQALGYSARSVDLHRELADTSGLRYALQHCAEATAASGDTSRAQELASEALALSREHGYRNGAAQALLLLAEIDGDAGAQESGREHARAAAELAGQLGDDGLQERAGALLASLS